LVAAYSRQQQARCAMTAGGGVSREREKDLEEKEKRKKGKNGW
jgi:hypothetical protein